MSHLLKSITLSFLMSVSFQNALAKIQVECPTQDKIAKMNLNTPAGVQSAIDFLYFPMRAGSVWMYHKDVGNPLVFVDTISDRDLTKSPLNSLEKTYLDSQGTPNTLGIFKIGYDFNAKECRRQILIDGPHATKPGVMVGRTRVSICDPGLMQIFAMPDVMTLDDFFKKVDALEAAGQMSPKDATKARNLLNMSHPSYYESDGTPKVRYLTDENGKILPRFEVDIIEMSYRKTKASFPTFNDKGQWNGMINDNNVCEMNFDHPVSYAGLWVHYGWYYYSKVPITAQLWSFNEATGVSEREDYVHQHKVGPEFDGDPEQVEVIF